MKIQISPFNRCEHQSEKVRVALAVILVGVFIGMGLTGCGKKSDQGDSSSVASPAKSEPDITPPPPTPLLVYSSFGPSNSFNPSNCFAAGVLAHAEWFVPQASGRLGALELAIEPGYVRRGREQTAGDETIFLAEDEQGFPGAILESFSVTANPPSSPKITAPLVLPSATHPTLQAGVKYWVGARGAGPGGWVWHFNNLEIMQNTAREKEPGKWASGGDYCWAGAFSVSVMPDPSHAKVKAATAPLQNRKYSLLEDVGHIHSGATNLNGGAARAVTVVDNLAYVANSRDGLRIYDVSNPADPINVGHSVNWMYAMEVAVSGKYAYVSADVGFCIFDVSTPANPIKVGKIGPAARAATIYNKVAYVATGEDGLRIYDVFAPAKPTEVGHAGNETNGCAVKVVLSGKYAFIANSNDGLRIYDVSDPTHPVSVGHVAGYALDVAVAGKSAYLATGGLTILDVSDPTNPTTTGGTNFHAAAHQVVICKNHAFFGTQSSGVRILDITNPAKIADVAQSAISGTRSSSIGIAVAGDYVYFANGLEGLRIYSLAGLPK